MLAAERKRGLPQGLDSMQFSGRDGADRVHRSSEISSGVTAGSSAAK